MLMKRLAIFLLYTALAAKPAAADASTFRGLGHVDSHQDVLTITFDLKSPKDTTSSDGTLSSKRRKSTKKTKNDTHERTVEVKLAQDKTALRSRKGDTGSVLWHASVDFARIVLQQHSAQIPNALLDPAMLSDAHILELGAGTGLLSIALSPLAKSYTVTDLDALMPLIRKNLDLNLPDWERPQSSLRVSDKRGVITTEPLDWVVLHKCSPAVRSANFTFAPIDLLLVVDCIYHPSLLPPLVYTIDYLATPGRTAVLVVMELRAEDVTREFLAQWLGACEGSWEIWHVNEMMEQQYAVWVGWKKLAAA